jgi:hypothetical protein
LYSILQKEYVFLSKSRHSLVWCCFIQADDMFRSLF